jgi:hypothetical protein
MRSCSSLTSSFASVVMIVHDSIGSSPLSHRSHSPANANGWPVRSLMWWGCFPLSSFFHS